MEIIKNFGIEPTLLIAQIVNFLIVFYILKRLLYKPVLNMLRNRESAIKEGLKKAEEARLLMEKTVEDEKKILKIAQLQADKLIEETKIKMQEVTKESVEYAKKQADKIMQEAREQIIKESRDTEEKLTGYISTLSVQFLEKTMKDFFNDKEQQEVIAKAIKKLKTKPN